MFFWRVENDKGDGPYCDSLLYDTLLYKHKDDEENHPLEHHLIMESLEKGKVFGFPSKEAAEVWFSEEEFRIMAVMGFHLKEMKGKFPVYSNFEYEEGKSRQLVFMPDYSNENK
jgi:hypothetical protein